MQYDADNERLVCAKALTHAPEIWDLACSPSADDLLISVWSQGKALGTQKDVPTDPTAIASASQSNRSRT